MADTQGFDVVIVGAGTAGAAAAYQLAAAGMRVALVERKPLREAGARWINGVAPWMFDRAGLARPVEPELRTKDKAFLLYSADGKHFVRVPRSPVWQIDMRRLVARLHGLAAGAGVVFFENASPLSVTEEAGRPVELVIEQKHGARRRYERLSGKLFVDASGLAGGLRRLLSRQHASWASPPRHDICSAAQEVRRIRNRAAAERWLADRNAKPGDSLSYVAVDGGYSTLVVQVDLEAGEVDLLTGSVADGKHRSGPQILADFVQREPWIGRPVFGGAGAIPIRRPFDSIVAPGVALLGDSACQVFPAHGSGIGTGLIAGALLREAVAGHGDPGGEDALWAYQRAFMREIGAVSAAYDVFRRLSQQLTPGEAASLISAGLTTPSMAIATLAQQMAKPALAELPQLVRAVRKAPALAAKLAPALARMQATHWLYRAFPKSRNGRRFAAWARLHGFVAGQGREAVGLENEPASSESLRAA